MCGLFAFTGPAGPDPGILADAARVAAARGPHAHGWATQPDGAHHRTLGPLDPATLTVTAPRLIGHCRLATRGDYTDPQGIQPCTADGHLVAHNGTIRNHRALAPGAPTDSVALARRYAHHRAQAHAPLGALEVTLAAADTPAWALLVLDSTGTLLAWRNGLPLWRLAHPTGVYYASRTFHPDAEPLAPDTPTVEEAPAP